MLYSSSAPYRPTRLQIPNLDLVEKKKDYSIFERQILERWPVEDNRSRQKRQNKTVKTRKG